jgi:hypothetical protein
MENISEFDLNIALRQWLDRFGQSPQVKVDNLNELESHLRDSVVQLQCKGLSSEESFLVATHRVGNPEKLGPEFAKVNRNTRDLVMHGLVLIFFSIGCLLLWGILHVPDMMVTATQGRQLPAFTRLVTGLGRSFLYVPPLLALVYCLYVWLRKSHAKSTWMGFFACTTTVLILVTLPTIMAVLLPMIDFMNNNAAK